MAAPASSACRLRDAHTVEVASHGSFWALLKDPKVFTMAFIYFLFLGANYTLVFFACASVYVIATLIIHLILPRRRAAIVAGVGTVPAS